MRSLSRFAGLFTRWPVTANNRGTLLDEGVKVLGCGGDISSRQVPQHMAKQTQPAVRKNHPLVGTWEEQDNPVLKTTVIYEIDVADQHFVVSGVDEESGDFLEVSKVSWDGEALRFSTYFPPTQWRARHVMRFMGRGRAIHDVRGVREYWIRRRERR